jgi:hypothetical protein
LITGGKVKYKVGDKVKVVRSSHPDVECLVNKVYFIEGIDTRGFGGRSCKIYLKGVDIWVLSKELAPFSVKYTELAAFMYPDGHKEGDRWILK